jgi:hypothetical protein
MGLYKLTPDQRDVLSEVRQAGTLALPPDSRGFARALYLQQIGLLRAVFSKETAAATFVLSGKGIEVASDPRTSSGTS